MTRPPKVFLDTDIILDLVLRREPFFRHSARQFQAGMDGRISLQASAASLKDVFYFARKARDSEKAGNEKRGRQAIRILLQVVGVCALDRQMWEEALASPIKDTEDALQIACAGRNHADFLVTRNARDYAGVVLPQVIQPEVLLVTLLSSRSAAP